MKFKIFLRVLNFEEQNKVMEPSVIIIIITAQYDYCISNKWLCQECSKEENFAVTVLLLLLAVKEDYKTFWPMSCICQVTARPAPIYKYPVCTLRCSQFV
jgi:hypothetical protein